MSALETPRKPQFLRQRFIVLESGQQRSERGLITCRVIQKVEKESESKKRRTLRLCVYPNDSLEVSYFTETFINGAPLLPLAPGIGGLRADSEINTTLSREKTRSTHGEIVGGKGKKVVTV